jgi:hypothetical protein
LLVESSGDPAEFKGEVKVSLYEIPEGKFPPGFEPFFVASQKGISFTSKPAYVTVPLDLPRLKANSWYAITFTLPNESMAKIVGYQVPNVAPTPFMGFENGVPFWGDEASGWKMLLNPYIQVDGWDVESQSFKTIQKRIEIGAWVVISLLLAIAIFGGLRWMKR